MNIQSKSQELEAKDAGEIVRWAIERYRPAIALSTSFGAGSAVLLHMVTQVDRKTPVLFLETGFHFKETLGYKEQLTKLLKLEDVREFKREMSSEDFFGRYGPRPFDRNPDECCQVNKVELLKKALKGLRAWISGVRRSQAHTRQHIQVLEEYEGGVIKINPLVAWSSEDVYEYMKKHGLPKHPLFEKGYTSIGCEPCTRAVFADGDERAGRWANLEKTECGIHTFLEPAAGEKGDIENKA